MKSVSLRSIESAIALCAALWWAAVSAHEPFIDAHIHFNWDQKEVIDATEVAAKLRRAGVDHAVVSSTPSRLALELKAAGGELILPIFSPYTHELGRHDWYLDRRTPELAEAGLRDGLYHGIGELHFMAGFRPRTDNPVFLQLVRLAREYSVPLLIHIDSANERMFIELCRRHPQAKMIFAHAGGNLEPGHIREILRACDNAMIEFSARDPWRFGGLTGGDDLLLAGWRELVLAYPQRFFTGTDPVWKVTRTQTWDQADDGWNHFERLIEYHRHWIADLPADVRRLVASENARKIFNLPRPGQ